VADQFIRVRLLKISGADLNLFDFDYDLTWVAFFLNADQQIYGRYGGRDAQSAEGHLSLAGLKYAMQASLAAHRRGPLKPPPAAGAQKPLLAEEYPAAKRLRKGECIHCHQVYEFRRAARKEAGQWRREEIWVYPLPENIGLDLEVDQGNRLRAVAPDSPAGRAGLRAGDILSTVNGQPVASFADVQCALHRAPARGKISIAWQSGDKMRTATLDLAEGWRKTNVTWRPSLLDILPSLTVFGEDLSAEEKSGLGLSAKRLAFRQQEPVHRLAQAAGVRAGDVIIGIDGQALEMAMLEFLAHVRKNYLVGDRITLNILRDGKRLDLPQTLK
jgi:membrane-associated protease RseP (regulator of RpoE activity)